MTSERACGTRPPGAVPGLTACSLCAGETLGSGDALDGGQLARLRALAARGTAQLTLAECLDECERGDVVVARPSGDARRTAGGRPVWFERVAGDELTGLLAGWLDAGGPGVDPVPDALAAYVIERGGEPGAEA